jgi:hypothetical protein
MSTEKKAPHFTAGLEQQELQAPIGMPYFQDFNSEYIFQTSTLFGNEFKIVPYLNF